MKKFKVRTQVTKTHYNEYEVECESEDDAWITIEAKFIKPIPSVTRSARIDEKVNLIREMKYENPTDQVRS